MRVSYFQAESQIESVVYVQLLHFLINWVSLIHLQAAVIYVDKREVEQHEDEDYQDEETEPTSPPTAQLNISVQCLPR